MKEFPGLEIPVLRQLYRNGEAKPEEIMAAIISRAGNYDEHNIWIELFKMETIQPFLDSLQGKTPDDLPLYGIPFAIKDNIDLAGVNTTAACEAFSAEAKESAAVVELLLAAGAIPVGKTNLDQFATGLVGTRSPEKWGAARNAFDKDYISGGSSSGSALAVSLGLASFALGTDTAGSGRVPAAFNNLVGLKPSKGLLSTRGVVPACRSLDCVSIFSLTAYDAHEVFRVASKPDSQDAYSRNYHFANEQKSFGRLDKKHLPVIGVLPESQVETYGDSETLKLYKKQCKKLLAEGFTVKEIDFTPFVDAAKLLYEGPWVAERFAACGEYLVDMLEVTAGIIAGGSDKTAVDAFRSQYKLQAFKKSCDDVFNSVDVVVTPTAPGHYTLEEVNENPVKLNSQLGYYTNFMNLLDYSAIAVPAGYRKNGLPLGVTFFAPAFDDLLLLSLANFLAEPKHTLGNTGIKALPVQQREKGLYTNTSAGESIKAYDGKMAMQNGRIRVAVCGAHLEGLPLNWQLLSRQGYLQEKTATAKKYRFYALAGGPPFRPGLIRVNDSSGESIAVEIWSVPANWFGSFVAGIPDPLGIGKIELVDGRWVSSFICEACAIDDAEDISAFANWRDFMASKQNA